MSDNKPTTFKIIHDRPVCIGCGSCAAVAPKFWKMHEDGKADLIGAENVGTDQIRILEDLEDNMDAAECCPVNCIHIFENDEKKI
jgi:ferredoxin